MNDFQPSQKNPRGRRLGFIIVLAVLVTAAIVMSGCSRDADSDKANLTPAERDARILAIASEFVASGDKDAAQAALAELDLANPGQSVLTLAETYIVENKGIEQSRELVLLAQALGPVSRMAREFLAQNGGDAAEAVASAAQPAPTDTALPPTDTPTPVSPSDTPEPTAVPTDTPEPTARPSDTPIPVPRVVAESQDLNVRGGPGTLYPVVGSMKQGDEAEVLARSEDRVWWQVQFSDGSQGWVFADLVAPYGPTDEVAVAANIAPPPATPTPAALPTATPAPQPAGPPFALVGFRLKPVGADAQSCTGGDHNIWVTVLDRGGAPMNGIRVKEIYTGSINVTGAQGKGDGRALWDIYRGGGGVVQVVDEASNPLSPQTPGMSADWPAFELIRDAGYCGCKPHPDDASCKADLESHSYLFTVGHYVYEVIFQQQ